MESYFNNMFQQSSSRRNSSAVDRFPDPGRVTNYLCGYSLRVCTLYLLWIHLVFDIFVFGLLITVTTYVTIRFEVVRVPNATLYTVTANKDKLFDIDMYSVGLDKIIILVGHIIAHIFFSWVMLDVVITIMALCGVYLNKLLLMVPYVVPIFTNIIWFVILISTETLFMLLKLMPWNWITFSVTILLLIKDVYRFIVLYSYFRMLSQYYFSPKHRTPQYFTTQSPHHSPVIDIIAPKTAMATTTTTTTTKAPSLDLSMLEPESSSSSSSSSSKRSVSVDKDVVVENG